MRIKKIILHPFAGIVNKTFHFENGLNVVLGDNEAGKSTLIKALIMVLFETTKQTPAKEKALLENLLPAAGGDTIAVDLEFEYDQKTYQLKKQWGKSKSSSLNIIGEAPITDAEVVQKKMDDMLVQNKKVWENVMFTTQANLSPTIDIVGNNNEISVTLDSMLQNSIINNAGIAPEDIQTQIEKRLKELTNNWDLANNKPVIGSNRKGSYDNPHEINKGEILKLDYKRNELEQKFSSRKNHDKAYDELISKIEELKQKYHLEIKSFLDAHKDHIDDFRKRSNLIKDRQIIQNEYKEIESDFEKWTTATSQIQLLSTTYEQSTQSKIEIEEELKVANKKKQGENVLEKFAGINNLSKEIEKLKEDQKTFTFIKPEDQKIIKEAHEQLKELNARFDALEKLQTFNVEVVLEKNGSVEITNGNDPESRVDLNADIPHIFKADGGFELKSNGLQIKVIAESENLKECEQKIDKYKEIQNQISQRYDSASIESLITSYKGWLRCEEEIKNKQSVISNLLGNQTIDQLTKDAEELKSLKPTRSMDDLSAAYKKAVEHEANSKTQFETAQKLIDRYTQQYVSIAELRKKEFDLSKKLHDFNESINALQPLPDEHVSAEALIHNFDAKLRAESLYKDEFQKLQLEKTKLEAVSDDRSASDYEEEITFITNEKNQKIAEALAIVKVKEKFEDIINRAPANPYDGYHNKMRHYLSVLSGGKYADFSIDKTLPDSIKQQNNIELKPGMLSQGTSGIMGMALRLSMADYFLENREGFLMLDDPMTEMDGRRQANAVNCLNDYAQTRQVIVFTCHESHADQFQGNKISLN